MKTYRELNDTGRDEIAQFVADNYNYKPGGSDHETMISEFMGEAESSLRVGDGACKIEMAWHDSKHGRTTEFRISAVGIDTIELAS